MSKITCSWVGRNNIAKSTILPKAINSFDAIPTKSPIAFFTELGQVILKFTRNHKRPKSAKATLKKMNKADVISAQKQNEDQKQTHAPVLCESWIKESRTDNGKQSPQQVQINRAHTLTPYSEINPNKLRINKMLKDLNIKHDTVKLLQEHRQDLL